VAPVVDSSGQVYRTWDRFPVFRRDARRHLGDDKDGLKPWMFPTGGDPALGVYDPNTSHDDGNDLAIQMMPVHTSIEEFAASWVDYGGNEIYVSTAANATNQGVVPYLQRTASGTRGGLDQTMSTDYTTNMPSMVPIPRIGDVDERSVTYYVNRILRPTAVTTTDRDEQWSRLAIDGLWLDGRVWNAPYVDGHHGIWDNRTVQQRRPGLLRIAFTLSNDPNPSAKSSDWTTVTRDRSTIWLRQPFAFSHPCGVSLPPP